MYCSLEGQDPGQIRSRIPDPDQNGRVNASSVLHTEHTELQRLLSGIHSIMRVKLAQADKGGGCTSTPYHYIYHHQ